MDKIKSYYFNNNQIVVRYNNKKEERLEFNQSNLNEMICNLNDQIKFDPNHIKEDIESLYDKLLYNAIFGTIIEFIIVISIFLSFISGMMLPFILTLVLLCSWVILVGRNIIIELPKFIKYNKLLRISEGRDILLKAYHSLENKNDDIEILDIC